MQLHLEVLAAPVRAKAGAFLEALAGVAGADLHSLYVVGSAVTADWVEGRSDVNTLLVLRRMDLGVLEAIAPLGRRFKGSGIAPPLVIDAAYVASSLDVFPMEFLEMRLIHRVVAGEDLLATLVIDHGNLRRQCEREVKSRLIGLRQGYLRSLGEPKELTEVLVRYLAGCQPLARGILHLARKEQPLARVEAFAALAAFAGPDAAVFTDLLAVKEGRTRLDAGAARALFERLHRATERLGRIVDELPA
jgi:hypothetical protein